MGGRWDVLGTARAATWQDPSMIVERALSERFLSNTYLVADGQGGPGFFVDAGGPIEPLLDAAKRLQVEPTHVLLTHHHFDHVSDLGALRKRWPGLQVVIHPLERPPCWSWARPWAMAWRLARSRRAKRCGSATWR